MRKLVWSTYATNAAQMVNMTFFALVLPLSIGFEQYGVYVSLYALPGLLQGMIETMYTVHLSRNAITTADLRTWVLLTVVAAIGIGSAHQALFGVNAAYAAIVLVALSARGLVTGLVYGCRTVNIVRLNVVAEVLAAVTYIVTLTVGTRFGLAGFEIPLTMMLASQFIAIVYLLQVLWRHGVRPAPSPSRFSASVFRFALSRAYEDSMFTLQPLTIALFAGNVAAGQYRYMVSVTKALSKIYPVRYEMLSRHEGELDWGVILRLAAVSAIAGVFVFGAFSIAENLYTALENPAHFMLLGSGIAVFVTTFLPLVSRDSPWFMARMLPLALIILVAPVIGGLAATQTAYLACNAIGFVLILSHMWNAHKVAAAA